MALSLRGWFSAPAAGPIGIAIGSDAVRMAQVASVNNRPTLIAAAAAAVPAEVRDDLSARFRFATEAIRRLMRDGDFRGRRVMLGLPAAELHLCHLRLPKASGDELSALIASEVTSRLPIEPSQAMIRHLVAGELFGDNEGARQEVIVMAARRELVRMLLACAERNKLDVAGLRAEPLATVDCFARLYQRAEDARSTFCFIDIGCSSTRVTIARGGHIYFARSVPVGADVFNQAVAASMNLPADEAKLMRLRLEDVTPEMLRPVGPAPMDERRQLLNVRATEDDVPPSDESAGFALLSAALRRAQPAAPPTAIVANDDDELVADPERVTLVDAEDYPQLAGIATPVHQPPAASPEQRIWSALQPALGKLADELKLCRRYHEATFPSVPIDRLVFVGGEARQRLICQELAKQVGVAAQVGDPMARLRDAVTPDAAKALDVSRPQPAWAAVLGLTIGRDVASERSSLKSEAA